MLVVPLISPDELEAVDAFLKRVTTAELQARYQLAAYSNEEVNFIFPAIRKLLSYGAKENQKRSEQTKQHDYQNMYMARDTSPRPTFIMAVTHTAFLKELLVSYRLAQAAYAERMKPRTEAERLFSMKISDMTQTEYVQFIKLIGGTRET